jgi:response regulator RpfG family c-di-GMP phosphodiesterase
MQQQIIKALYIDDETLMHKAFSRALRRQPVEIRTAANALEAVGLTEHYPFDVIFSDYALGNTDGLLLIKRLKDTHPGVVFVLVSGSFDWRSREAEMEAAGVDYFLAKPWERDELEGILKEVIRRKGQA